MAGICEDGSGGKAILANIPDSSIRLKSPFCTCD